MTNFSCEFDPDMPSGCPPTAAYQADQTVYRCVDNNRPQPIDFESDVRAKRRLANPEICQSWGCSVWLDELAVEHALRIFKSFRKKYIVRGTIEGDDGALQHTPSDQQPNHHTFWQAESVDVSPKFEVFIACGERV